MANPPLSVLLYGPPASGKDTITKTLVQLNPRYQLFPRLKHGPGRSDTYRMTTALHLAELRAIPGEVLWENERYGATYVIDRSHFKAMISQGVIPVIHLGQPEALSAIKTAEPSIRMLTVSLTVSRDLALTRITARHTGDTAERMIAYDLTPTISADLVIDTGHVSPDQAAKLIDHTAAVLQ